MNLSQQHILNIQRHSVVIVFNFRPLLMCECHNNAYNTFTSQNASRDDSLKPEQLVICNFEVELNVLVKIIHLLLCVCLIYNDINWI